MVNKKAYVSPGSFGCGIASKPINPMAAILYGITMKGHRV
jgi:hypothetical protein